MKVTAKSYTLDSRLRLVTWKTWRYDGYAYVTQGLTFVNSENTDLSKQFNQFQSY